jgi:hypothetical protein
MILMIINLILGAWWLGWLILACALFGFAFFMCLFPKELPRGMMAQFFT